MIATDRPEHECVADAAAEFPQVTDATGEIHTCRVNGCHRVWQLQRVGGSVQWRRIMVGLRWRAHIVRP